jgi:hypothetical protein
VIAIFVFVAVVFAISRILVVCVKDLLQADYNPPPELPETRVVGSALVFSKTKGPSRNFFADRRKRTFNPEGNKL